MPGFINPSYQLAVLNAAAEFVVDDLMFVGLYTDVDDVGRPLLKSDFTLPTGANLQPVAIGDLGPMHNKPNDVLAFNSEVIVFHGTGVVTPQEIKGVMIIGGGNDAAGDPVHAYFPFAESKLISGALDVINVVPQFRMPLNEDFFSVDLAEGD